MGPRRRATRSIPTARIAVEETWPRRRIRLLLVVALARSLRLSPMVFPPVVVLGGCGVKSVAPGWAGLVY